MNAKETTNSTRYIHRIHTIYIEYTNSFKQMHIYNEAKKKQKKHDIHM